MNPISSKISAVAILGFSGLSLLLPGFALAGNDGWRDLNWQQSHRATSGMWQLESWLSDVQKRWDHSDNNHHDNNDHRQNVNVNYGGNNNVNVRQHQEVTGDFKSVTMEQAVRVYVNGELTESEQQLSVHKNGDNAEQWQEVSVRGN